MEVVVQLQAEAARLLHEHASLPAPLQELQQFLEGLGGVLAPVHPDSKDPGLRSYFIVSGLKASDAETVAQTLNSLDEVESAYVQPTPLRP